jgi:hypothetical protein
MAHDRDHSPVDVSRRGFLRGIGAGIAVGVGAAGTPMAARADDGVGRRRSNGFLWLAGDHHVHTQFSHDGMYRVVDQVRHASAHGLDWVVIADHGHPSHATVGLDALNAAIVAARAQAPDTLVFQGLEWNVPAADHGTVFVHPGPEEVAVLKEFENGYDSALTGATDSTADNEAQALAGLNFLAGAVAKRRVRDVLFLANHPSRRGVDTPHEIRGWRDAQPQIAIGFEGAPGHQAAGIFVPYGLGVGRGLYSLTPGSNSYAGYPAESYRTWGGFDWMTATVGGLWDSLLAEGKPWLISANSDVHNVYVDTATPGPGSDYATNGHFEDPVYGGLINPTFTDYWPGLYSRTHVGARTFSYADVMAGLRAGRVWVDHGGLISAIDVRLRAGGQWVTLGGTLTAPRGSGVELVVTIDLANGPNWAQFAPKLGRVDVIRGAVNGPAADRDSLSTPDTSVVHSVDVNARYGTVSFTYDLGTLDKPFYVRLRGTDGHRSAPGFLGAAVDPAGPAMDVPGSADPWNDLWFYTNAMFASPA